MKTAIYPGSFDPVTLGHLDIIKRGSGLFDKLIVAVLVNPGKHCAFSVAQRMEMLRTVCRDLPNVEVDSFTGLLADYVAIKGADAVLRGLRGTDDYISESRMALINRDLNPKMDTVFLVSSGEHAHISSSAVREIAAFGGDYSAYVPVEILPEVAACLNK
ncbi:MAG: pantetheine-phosphate adenylyltransferase [Clostridia bacterium]|nr:pantetheine-phosphate adenylyltransferase [Clostridia bacterium]